VRQTSRSVPDLKPLKAVFDRRLLFDRNARMVARMQPQLKSGQAFVAVGALHLYGEQGLLSLLTARGLPGVARVLNDCAIPVSYD